MTGRENLYRGKCVNGVWVEGYYATDGNRHYIITEIVDKDHAMYGHYSDNVRLFVVIPETVGQYTGLCDKNGKRIFEGDIVKFGKHFYQIIFECGSFALLDKDGEMISKIGGMNDHCYSLMNLHLECCWEDDCAYDIEVIGNIHDNPELLKGGVQE